MRTKFVSMLFIYLTLATAIVFNMMIFPSSIQFFKPNFLLLVVLYWIVKVPRKINIGHAFVCGLLLDMLYGSILGIRAFSYSLMAYLMVKTFVRMETYSLLQQSLSIMIISALGQIISFWLEHVFGLAIIDYHMIFSSFSDAFTWPFLVVIMNFFMKFGRHSKSDNNV